MNGASLLPRGLTHRTGSTCLVEGATLEVGECLLWVESGHGPTPVRFVPKADISQASLFDIGLACYLCRRGSQTIAIDQIIIILLGALAGGVVNGLTGFGTGITAIGLWLYTISPPVAASLVIICSVVSHLQTLPMIWHAIKWKRVLPFVAPGFVGVPMGTMLLSQIDPRMFKIGVGLFLVSYATYVLARKVQISATSGGRVADGAVGFCGGVLGGLAGLSGALLVVWTDICGYPKEYRRSVLQTFNLSILTTALISHAYSGLLTRQVGLATLAALPGTVCGAWLGATIYKRLGDHGFQQIVMWFLLLSGVVLIWTNL